MDNNSHYFYVLLCADGTYYGGYTTEPKRRLKEHNDGVGAKYTRAPSRMPVRMIYAESFATKSEAMKAEYAFKKMPRAKKIIFLETRSSQERLLKFVQPSNNLGN